jgi:protein-S-isoprenylcysteine O-methyltransferase Ste14
MRAPGDVFEWGWLVLFVVTCVVRKIHERRSGGRSSMAGTPVTEIALMGLWGVLAGVAPLLVIFTPVLDFAGYPFNLPWVVRAAGLALFVVALWLLHRSHADLGRNWSRTVDATADHRLVTEGVYRRVRHPMYAAHILWSVSQGLLFPNAVAGPAAVFVMLAILRTRIPREERAMLDRFGDSYREYRERSGRILPW